jgi:hypothetical protein
VHAIIGRRKTLGDRCSPDIADVGPASISISSSYSYRIRADIVPISGRNRADIGPKSGRHRPDRLLLSGLLNDFESKKENLSFENYIYDQEYFDTFTKYDQNILQYILRICSALINFYSITFIHIYFFNIFRIM